MQISAGPERRKTKKTQRENHKFEFRDFPKRLVGG